MSAAPIEEQSPPAQRWRRRLWLLLCAGSLHGADALAQPEPSTVRVQLEFSAPNDCAEVASFKQQVAQRSERIVFVEEPPVDGMAKVALSRVDAGVLVRLSWLHQERGATGREFKALNCAEAIEAAALVIAITFDPSAPVSEAAESPDGSRAPSRDTREPTEPETDNQPPEPDREGDPETQALNIPATDAGALTAPRYQSTFAVTVGVSASVEGIQGVTPAPMDGFGLGTALGFGDSLLAPQIRLAWLHFLGITYPADGGDAVFQLDAARFSVCPIRLGPSSYNVRPCAFGVGGRFTASGQDTENPQSHTRPLWLFGAALIGSSRPVSVLLITGEIGLSAPLSRDRFQFQPDQFHQVSSLVLTGGLGIGIEYP